MAASYRSRNKLMLLAAIVLAVGPFAAAGIRVVQTRNDFRYLWVALAALVGATAVMSVARAGGQLQGRMSQLSAVAFLAATLFAVLVARLLGARAIIGIVLVAIVYAVFFTGSQVLYTLSRQREI
jgi:O-antigen/teichoic acid export membrane protein